MLGRIAERFGARLHAPAVELLEIGQHAHVDVPLASRHVDANGIEVIPTPGHSPGSTCYLVPGANGQTYLFTGDTIMLGADGDWVAGYIPPISDSAPLSAQLATAGHAEARSGDLQRVPEQTAVYAPGTRWAECVEQAQTRLAAVA